MKTELLTQLLHAPRDLDYVERFQGLAAVNLEIRRSGPTAERLLRKAALEMDVGNPTAGLAAAQDAAALSPDSAEAHFLIGKARILLALVKAHALTAGPGGTTDVEDSATGLLLGAADAFRQAVRLNPADDESLWDLAAVEALLAKHASDRELAKALRAAA